MILGIYSFFIRIAFLLSFVLKYFLPPKTKHWIDLRNQKTEFLQTQCILFHASSGEIEYVKSLIRKFKQQFPDFSIVVSYSSPSALRLFKNIEEVVDHFVPVPWDFPRSMNIFLNQLNPQVIIFSKTDFWPHLIQQATKKDIPLFAVSMHSNPSWFQKMWYRQVLKDFQFLTAVDQITTNYLKDLFPQKKIYRLADTRFEQVFHRLSTPSLIRFAVHPRTIVFGSTWPEDEKIILKIIDQLVENGFHIIIAPHDVHHDHIESLMQKLAQHHPQKFSTLQNEPHLPFSILVVDTIGVLADLYRYSQVSFVGGSFKKKVHSVMEPLCAGNFVIVGPYFKNNPEAVQYHGQFVFTVQNEFELFDQICRLSRQNNSKLQVELQKQLGSTDELLKLLEPYIIKH